MDFSTGELSINTDTATWTHSSGASGAGEVKSYTWTDPQGNDITYSKAEFVFDRINIGSSVTVTLSGNNPIVLQTQSNGNITIGANFVANGGDGKQNRTTCGVGMLGGADGGRSNYDPGAPGGGIGGGGQTGTGHETHFRQWVAGGGSYGGLGSGTNYSGRTVDPAPYTVAGRSTPC